MATKTYLNRRDTVLSKIYDNEVVNPNLNFIEHNIVSSMARYHNALALAPEKIIFQEDYPIFKVYEHVNTSLPDYTSVVDAYNDLTEKKAHFNFSGENRAILEARDRLNIELKRYVEAIDKKYGTHYYKAIQYGAYKGAADSIKDQRGNAIEHYTEIRYTNNNLTDIQHQFVAGMALYRHEIHAYGESYLVQNGTGKAIYKFFSTMLTDDIMALMGFDGAGALKTSFDELNKERDLLCAAVKEKNDVAINERITSYIEAKENFNYYMEVFLKRVDKVANTSYSPKKDHRPNLEIITKRNRDDILHVLKHSDLNEFIETTVTVSTPQQPKILNAIEEINIKEVGYDKVDFNIQATPVVEESERKKRVTALSDKADEGFNLCMKDTELYKQYLKISSRFLDYSAQNTMLLMLQCPDAQKVATLQNWSNKYDRIVSADENAIQLIIPRKMNEIVETVEKDKNGFVVKDENGEVCKDIQKQNITRHVVAPVFDVSQTTGHAVIQRKANFDFSEAGTGYQELKDILEKYSRVPIEYKDLGEDTSILSSDKITLNSNISDKEFVYELINDISHLKLGHKNMNKQIDRVTQWLEADTVSFLVCEKLGLDTSRFEFDYLESWADGKNFGDLKKCDTICQRIADIMISGLNKYLPYKKDYIGLEGELFEEHSNKVGIYQSSGGDEYKLTGVVDYSDDKDFQMYQQDFEHPGELDIGSEPISIGDVLVFNKDNVITSYQLNEDGFHSIENFTGDEREIRALRESELSNYLIENGYTVSEEDTMVLYDTLASRNKYISISGDNVFLTDKSNVIDTDMNMELNDILELAADYNPENEKLLDNGCWGRSIGKR